MLLTMECLNVGDEHFLSLGKRVLLWTFQHRPILDRRRIRPACCRGAKTGSTSPYGTLLAICPASLMMIVEQRLAMLASRFRIISETCDGIASWLQTILLARWQTH